ncbi:meiotic cell cortex C-terminal pleckstrin homology-domain-containing protein [Absidia repens]|uniref:Meiotic cell cortex C-terminal pleckstrin homology-domain-containing protein n=1 Tax=Absidia repens TaxID=90262 RepID=A0A1X2ITY5_9FUNG|nr:meiotic cell cortex C-terminal pleckstrin homology-domain-containing protein [Absidia repens]
MLRPVEMTNQDGHCRAINTGVKNGATDRNDQQKPSLTNTRSKTTMGLQNQLPYHHPAHKPSLPPNHHCYHHRQQQGDIELATGTSHEIRRMQELLQEKNDSLATLSLENVDAQEEMNRLTNQLERSKSALERGKEEIWALELEKQDLVQQINDLQHQVKRASVNQTQLIGHEKDLKQELESMKQQQVTWKNDMEQAKRDKLKLETARRKLYALEQQLPEHYATVPDLSHTSSTKDIDVDDETNTLSILPSPLPNPSPSQSLPVKFLANNARQQRQHQGKFIAINSELHASLTIANDTIKKLQCTLENEQKKRTEMEILWRDAQEMIENYDIGKLTISVDDTTTPSNSPSAASKHYNDYQQHHQSHPLFKGDTNDNDSKRSRNIRQKRLSLGDELVLAGSSDNTPGVILSPAINGDTDGNHKNGKLSSSSMLGSFWKSEMLSIHTNIDEILDIDQSQAPACLSHGILDPANKIYATITTEQQEESMEVETDETGDTAHDSNSDATRTEDEPYGSILTTGSYIYQPSMRDISPPQENQQQHRNDTRSSKMTYDILSMNNSDVKHNGSRYIQALTRTMIGDWMWKYTRKMVGIGISENRHERFCWLHPYSKTLYWSTHEPGIDGLEHATKCVMIDSFKVISGSGIPSFLIHTHGRYLKIQCRDSSTYSVWFNSLKYLLVHAPLMNSSFLDRSMNKDPIPKRQSNPDQYHHPLNAATAENHRFMHAQPHPYQYERHENPERPSSSSSPTALVTMSTIQPPPASWHMDSALSSTTVAGSSSISLPFLPQKGTKPSPPTPKPTATLHHQRQHHHPALAQYSNDGFNSDHCSLLTSSLRTPSQVQHSSWIDFN